MKIFTYIVDTQEESIECILYCNNKFLGYTIVADNIHYCSDFQITFIKELYTDDPILWGEVNNKIALTN